ncbi:hypothetical protein J2S78_002688 [Salibacterium salarium]|uniref:DUF3231 family protein n=1 Tax=Salibacterium salarium TaxID=284579 RepID=UPI00277D1CF2|nr:DUF3231 family protein [Salibacterium salarium]MDQ0300241.1 hypothetical protein [Salibacterium salarium]
MELDKNTNITSAEHAQLWNAYMNASITSTIVKYFLAKVEDPDIESVLQEALTLTTTHAETLTHMFTKENKPVPIGFNDQDLNTNAPRLYSDNYFLQHILQLGMAGMFSFSAAINLSIRHDIYTFFSEGFQKYNHLHQKAASVSLEKGLYLRPPTVPTPNEVDFVKKRNFLTGWFGKRRPLMTQEIAYLFSNLERNSLGIAMLTGFSQVVKSKEVKNYIIRGIEIAKKHVNIFRSILEENHVPTPMGSDSMVTDSANVSPFSDKLIMYHVTGMTTLGIGFYGLSISTNIRRDLSVHYTRLTAEIALYSEDGATLMIDNEWLEEPPRMVNRDELVRNK